MVEGALQFLPEHFARSDGAADTEFYASERMVHHLDEPARSALTAFYRRTVPEDARVLDLMSSWVSHLPEDHGCQDVTGLGMNAAELSANSQLTAHVVHDLNAKPVLPFDDQSFDACLIALSVQYLTRPLDVFGDISRVLRPEGVCIVSFSNRCFPTKAVAVCGARLMIRGISGLSRRISGKPTGSMSPSMKTCLPVSAVIPSSLFGQRRFSYGA